MSSLWRRVKRNMTSSKQLKTNYKRPSPRHKIDCQNRQILLAISLRNVIKKISQFISCQKATGSMTVEAAVVLPLFLFFFCNMGCAIEMLRLHGNLELSLYDIGNRMAIYGYAFARDETEGNQETPPGWWSELGDAAWSYGWVRGELIRSVGEEYLDTSPIEEGVRGLFFLESEIVGEDDCLDLIVTYKVSPSIKVAGFRPFRMANRYYAHLWNGYCIPGTELEAEDGKDLVYLAENGRVYHEKRDCSHLRLQIRDVTLEEAFEKRNVNGARYLPCEICSQRPSAGAVYITEDGTAIHFDRNCSGLKRTVYAIPRSQVLEYPPCSTCGK